MAQQIIPGVGDVLIAFAILFVVYLVAISFILWVAGEIIVGRRVTYGQALAIAGIGTFLVVAVIFLLPTLLGLLAGLFIFLALVRHYFKTGWLGAIGVSVMSVVVAVVLSFVLVLAIGSIISIPTIQRFF